MSKINQHVVPHDGDWAVRSEGSRHPSSVHDTQAEAIARGRAIAQREGSELIVHGRDGRIRVRDSHGRDPHPPRG
jgi:uncharacterized protein YdaT